MRTLLLPAVLLAAATLATGCAPKFNTENDRTPYDHDALSGNNLWDLVNADPELSTFAGLVKLAGAVQILQEENPYFTVFAPHNDAFDDLPEGWLDQLRDPGNHEFLVAVVTHHILEERMPTGEIPDEVFETLYGNTVNLGSKGGETVINHATVMTPDMDASNGIVHVIDAVLIPQR